MSEDDFNGQRIGYQITYVTVNSKSDFHLATVNYTMNFTELTNLTAFTEYVVTVSAVSSGGVGPKALIIARTDEAGKFFCLSISCLIENKDNRTCESARNSPVMR